MKQKNRNLIIGKLGEDLACEYLKRKNYQIIDRNYRKPWGEIDIIARFRDKTLVFVEVKTMRSLDITRDKQFGSGNGSTSSPQDNTAIGNGNHIIAESACGELAESIAGLKQPSPERLKPEDQLTAAKLNKLKRTASLYANKRAELINERKGWRLDLIAIILPADLSLESFNPANLYKNCLISHYENI